MIILIKRSVMVQLRTLESTPYHPKSIKTFGSPAELPTPIQDTPEQVIVDNNGSPAEEQGAYRYCYCVRSAFHLSNTPWNNRTTIAQVPRFNPFQSLVQVYPCTIRPGTASSRVLCRPECSTTQGQCGSECSPNTTTLLLT